jgi:hypothetical protein
MSVSAVGSELLAVFHEGMVQERDVPARKYWPGQWPILDEQENDEPVVSVRSTGSLAIAWLTASNLWDLIQVPR